MTASIVLAPILGLTVLFTLRRYALLVASGWSAPVRPALGVYPTILIVVPARNEEARLPALLSALTRLEYPADKLRYLLIDDASQDRTAEIFAEWASGHGSATAVSFPRNQGKANALNYALDHNRWAELIGVYDADLEPHPEALQLLAAPFSDPRIGAVSGYRQPADPYRSVVSRYSALESWVHQLVTQAAKDRLGWNPTTLGAHCLYRRAALLEAGAFVPGSFSEDIDISLALVAAGWRTRFLPRAIAQSEVAGTVEHYMNQRARWTRGLYQSGRKASGLESLIVSTGYVDRLVFLCLCVAVVWQKIHPVWPVVYLSGPVLTSATALQRAGAGFQSFFVFIACVPMFVMDVFITLSSTLQGIGQRSLHWRTGGQR